LSKVNTDLDRITKEKLAAERKELKRMHLELLMHEDYLNKKK